MDKEKKARVKSLKIRLIEKVETDLFLWCLAQAKNYKENKLSKGQLKKLKEIKFPFKFYLKKLEKMQKFINAPSGDKGNY